MPSGYKSIAPMGPISGDVTLNNDTAANFSIGRSFEDKFGNKFIYVLFGYTSAQGDAVAVDLSDASNVEGTVKVIQPIAAALENFAGIAMNAVTSGNFGFIQTYGYSQVAVATNGAVSAGDSLKLSATHSYFVSDAAKGTNPSFINYAKAITAPVANVIAAGGAFILSFLKSAA